MSTVAMVPPPNSSSVLRRVPRLTAQARQLLTAVNIHFAGVAALIVLDLYLLAHLFFAWQAVNTTGPDAISQQRTMLRAAQIAGKPLEGIDDKLTTSTEQANLFYQKRLPYAYSQVLTELGVLQKRSNVRLARVQYGQLPQLSGASALTMVNMDASISGDYRPVIGFINALERDRMFFVITGITLTGQQTGQVNLRLRIVTYLRAAGPDEMSSELPMNTTAEPATAPTTTTGSGGPQ